MLGVDALYISHIHPDHCDPETLKYFRRDIKIVTLADKHSFCAKHLAKMGFTNVAALGDRERRALGPFRLTMFGPFTKHPHHDCDIGNVVDSALLVQHGDYSVLNTNDNTPSLDVAAELAGEYGAPTIAQLNYNSAGPYPACFLNLSTEEKQTESARLVQRNLTHMVSVAHALGSRYVQPFAGAYKITGERAYMNDYLGTCSAEYAAQYLRDNALEALLLGEQEAIDVAAL